MSNIRLLQDLHSEVTSELVQIAKTEPPSRLEWFKQQHQRPGLSSYGIRIPKVRKLIKRYTPRFKQLSLKDKLNLAMLFFKSGVFDQATIGDALIELGLPEFSPHHFPSLDETVEHFNNWASVDWLSLRVMQPLLLEYTDETLTLLRKWNTSKNLWKRRASVVSFVRKIGASGKFIDIVLGFCDNLIWDEEELVQKGVGWALKDNILGARERVLDYIRALRRKGVSSVITLYAIRELKGKERASVLDIKPL
ncbi:MAG: DNA alkylation repair protein [Promethearchaeota archaeon]